MNDEITANELRAKYNITPVDITEDQPQHVKTILLYKLHKQTLLPVSKHFLLALQEALMASVRST